MGKDLGIGKFKYDRVYQPTPSNLFGSRANIQRSKPTVPTVVLRRILSWPSTWHMLLGPGGVLITSGYLPSHVSLRFTAPGSVYRFTRSGTCKKI